jgi:predicted DNA-binding protein (UPF0251 family)
VSWELITTNPVYKMFRTEELEQEQNEDIYMSLEEIEAIEQIKQQMIKKGYISGNL